jgi:predicted AAA+ superfamily ATPase
MNISELVIYRNLKHEDLFEDMAGLMGLGKEGQKADPFACAGELVELAVEYGFEGNLWHCFLALCLADNENAYTTTCEIRGNAGGTLDMLAKNDYRIFKALFDYDLETLEPAAMWKEIAHYRPSRQESRVFNRRIRDRIVDLAVLLEQSEDENEFQSHMAAFYGEYGVGKFGLNKAFRIIEKEEEHKVIIDPIINVEHIYFKDIVGYEMQKKKLIENTEAFISGKEANNVLLFGDAGTGKSSSVKAILNEYYGQGLRMIEVYKHQFKALSEVLEQIKDRNYKFIIYMDDLSFEEYELEYKYLKAILEGGLGKRPKNVLIYATSNRRHLIRESMADRQGDEVRVRDTLETVTSLSDRFGLEITFSVPDKDEYLYIVEQLAKENELNLDMDELHLLAERFALRRNGRSPRTARQFISQQLAEQYGK